LMDPSTTLLFNFSAVKQRPQLLIQRRFRHHSSAVAQREGEAPEFAFAFPLQRTQMPPIHLGLLPRWCLEASHGYRSCRATLRLQPIFQNRVAAAAVLLS
jgi:hypothetical protein